MTTASEEKETTEVNAPVLIDLGKHKRKRVKQLRKGKAGRLLDEGKDCIAELQGSGTINDSIQPVVIIVHEKKRKRKFW